MKKLASKPSSKAESGTATVSPQPEMSSITESALPVSEVTSDELDRLRDILFGSQTRVVERRLIDLENSLQTIQKDLENNLQTVQKDLLGRLDKQAAEQTAQLRTAQKALNNLIEQLRAELAERTRKLQAETRQLDDSLRQELLNMAASLENKKASRQDLGQMLIELGHRLQRESKPPPSDNGRT